MNGGILLYISYNGMEYGCYYDVLVCWNICLVFLIYDLIFVIYVEFCCFGVDILYCYRIDIVLWCVVGLIVNFDVILESFLVEVVKVGIIKFLFIVVVCLVLGIVECLLFLVFIDELYFVMLGMIEFCKNYWFIFYVWWCFVE